MFRIQKLRGHPELNQGPLDLQSNALPLSYIPVGHVPIYEYFEFVYKYGKTYRSNESNGGGVYIMV